MAILGGLLRSSMCRWMEGMALKKEQPGMSKVCMIIGLRFVLAVVARGGLDFFSGDVKESVHCQVTA